MQEFANYQPKHKTIEQLAEIELIKQQIEKL